MAQLTVPDFDAIRSAHLVGIGGAAMTPLATILLQKGVRVSGSDLAEAQHLQTLRALGATVAIGHRAGNVGLVDVVVTSSAVPEENAELSEARARRIPVVKHSQALGALMRSHRPIAVAGTHGKSTTTALIAYLLDYAGLNPTFHVGAELINYGCFGRFGRGEFLVAEADEFDRRFLDYDPEVIVITSVEPDHLDYYGDFGHLVEAFQAFLDRLRPRGCAVICQDDPVARSLTVPGRRITYGVSPDAGWQVLSWEADRAGGSRFALRSPTGEHQIYHTLLLGSHNACNAAAAVAVGQQLGVSIEALTSGLASFRGVHRRLEPIGAAGGVTVIDDYAHHPTAVRASLEAVKAHWTSAQRQRPAVWIIYQPHTEHRTASLFAEFAQCFGLAEHVIVTPAYMPSGRVLSDQGAGSDELVAAMKHSDARALPPQEAAQAVAANAAPGDVVVVMGAGDIWTIERPLLDALAARTSPPPAPSPVRGGVNRSPSPSPDQEAGARFPSPSPLTGEGWGGGEDP